MGDHRTIRAWKDLDFRASLDPNEGAALVSPVGDIELADADLGDVSGGMIPITQTSICATSPACMMSIAVGISSQISCGNCAESLWHGTCGFSSVGCC